MLARIDGGSESWIYTIKSELTNIGFFSTWAFDHIDLIFVSLR